MNTAMNMMSMFYTFTKPLLNSYCKADVDKKLGQELRSAVKKVTAKGYLVGGKHHKNMAPIHNWLKKALKLS